MDAPKCKICNKRHYGQCAGLDEFSKYMQASPPEKKEIMAAVVSAAVRREGEKKGDRCPTCGTNLAARRKERERRRLYMRGRRTRDK
jgi:hypothetical protein